MSDPVSMKSEPGRSMQPGWIECGCCAGLEWGGEYPRECRDCHGYGFVWRYSSGRLAPWPGGPFMGQEHPDYVRKVTQR